MGVIQKSGAWFAYNEGKIGQGRENAKIYLKEHPEVLDEVEAKVRAAYGLDSGLAGGTLRRERRLKSPAGRTETNYGV